MRTLRLSLAVLAGLTYAPLAAAETFPLIEDAASGRTFSVAADVTADGTFEFQSPEQGAKPVEHPVTMKAGFKFVERRLPPAGRDEAAFRTLRLYEQASSEIRVGGHVSSPALRKTRYKVVARATREGVSAYSPDGPLTANEIELIPFPGDSLILPALLPGRPVAVGESWEPPSWVAPALAGADLAIDHKLTCRLDAVRDGRATVTLDGKVQGASKGANSETTLSGQLTYDLKFGAITDAEITQKETRAIGPLSPGMKLTLTSAVRRNVLPPDAGIADQVAEAVPLETSADSLRVEYAAPFGVSLAGDRDWQLFHQTGQLLILRLLDRGGLIAQCNLAPAPTVKPGERTPEPQFQEDIRRSLGEQLTEIVSAEEVKTPGDAAIYRVTAAGKVKETERVWRYYLVTAPDGRQAAFVFTVEPTNLRRLDDRDLKLVTSLRFLAPAEPRPAQRSTDATENR